MITSDIDPKTITLTYRPPRYSPKEIAEFTEFRQKAGKDFRLCQNNRLFRVKSRAMRKVIVGITVDNDIFLLFNVEYGWHSKPQTNGGSIEIVTTELIEINEMEPSIDDKMKYRDNFRNNDEFKRNLIEADYYKYG